MALDSYTGLKASVADWLNRSDLTAVVPDFITLAETMIARRLLALTFRPRQMMGRSDATIDDEFIQLPNDFVSLRSLILEGSTENLEYVEPEKITERKTLYPDAVGDPEVFSIVGDELQFWPWTDGSYTAELTYNKSFTPLSDSNTSNWVLEKHPDLYLYGSLMQAAPYLQDDARVPVWQSKFDTALNEISLAASNERQGPHLAMTLVRGGTP